jgi:predicted nucleotidyltransferase
MQPQGAGVGAMHRGRFEQAQAYSASGPCLVIGDEPIIDAPVANVRSMRRPHNAIAKLNPIDRERRKNTIKTGNHGGFTTLTLPGGVEETCSATRYDGHMATTVFEVRDGRAFWDGQSLSEWAGKLAAELVTAFRPVEVWLFGSVARGEDDGDSDLDVLVVLDSYAPTDAVALKLKAIRSVTVPVPFDAAFTDSRRMASRRKVAGTLERAVSLDGQRLYRRA